MPGQIFKFPKPIKHKQQHPRQHGWYKVLFVVSCLFVSLTLVTGVLTKVVIEDYRSVNATQLEIDRAYKVSLEDKFPGTTEVVEIKANPQTDKDVLVRLRYQVSNATIVSFAAADKFVAVGACNGGGFFTTGEVCADLASSEPIKQGETLARVTIKWSNKGAATILAHTGNSYYDGNILREATTSPVAVYVNGILPQTGGGAAASEMNWTWIALGIAALIVIALVLISRRIKLSPKTLRILSVMLITASLIATVFVSIYIRNNDISPEADKALPNLKNGDKIACPDQSAANLKCWNQLMGEYSFCDAKDENVKLVCKNSALEGCYVCSSCTGSGICATETVKIEHEKPCVPNVDTCALVTDNCSLNSSNQYICQSTAPKIANDTKVDCVASENCFDPIKNNAASCSDISPNVKVSCKDGLPPSCFACNSCNDSSGVKIQCLDIATTVPHGGLCNPKADICSNAKDSCQPNPDYRPGELYRCLETKATTGADPCTYLLSSTYFDASGGLYCSQDEKTLLSCTYNSADKTIVQDKTKGKTCSGKCIRAEKGSADYCSEDAPTGPTGNPTVTPTVDPSTNPTTTPWDCAKSSYQDKQYKTCADGKLNWCENGVPKQDSCSDLGCTKKDLGVDDVCNTSGSKVVCGKVDTNDDLKINFIDLAGFASVYNKLCSDTVAKVAGTCGGKDTNADGKVDYKDLLSFANRYSIESAPKSCVLL